VEPRQIIRSSIAASAIVHLSFLLLLIFFTEVHPFRAVKTDTVSVDIVTPDQVKEKPPEPPPLPKIPDKAPDRAPSPLDLAAKAASAPASAQQATASPPAATPPAAAPPPAAAAPPAAPQQAAKPSPPAPAQQQAALPQPAPTPALGLQQPAAQPQTQARSPIPSPAYQPAQPDLSIKYHVLLGLPQARPGDGFDAAATEKADIGSSPIAEFRRHLKTCSALPKEVAASDKVAIKLRVAMTPDGRLATDPVLIEASASMKGPLLMQSAINALRACQPYTMMPADKYNEWKVLDLSFTPQDFGDAS
jgi:hypothetical protein